MFEAIRFITLDLFGGARSMLKRVNFGDFNLYSLFVSYLVIYIIFKFTIKLFRSEE